MAARRDRKVRPLFRFENDNDAMSTRLALPLLAYRPHIEPSWLISACRSKSRPTRSERSYTMSYAR